MIGHGNVAIEALRSKIAKKMNKKVELVSPLPKKDNNNNNNNNNKNGSPKNDKPKEVITLFSLSLSFCQISAEIIIRFENINGNTTGVIYC